MDKNDSSNTWQLTTDGANSAVDSIVIERMPVEPTFVAQIKPCLEGFAQRHHLAGLVSGATLFAKLPDDFDDNLLDRPLRVLPWGWPGRYGASFTLSVLFAGSSFVTRVVIPQSAGVDLDRLRDGMATLVLVRGQRAVARYNVDFTENPSALEYLRFHVDGVRNHAATLLADSAAHYWETLNCQMIFRERFTPSDLLSLGWYDVFDNHSWGMTSWLADVRKERRIPPSHTHALPSAVAALVSVIEKERCTIHDISTYFKSAFQGASALLVDFIRQLLDFGSKVPQWEEAAHLVAHLITDYLRSSDVTDCGRQLPWYDSRSDSFSMLLLERKHFPPTCNPREYWKRLPWDLMNGMYGFCIGGSDFPIDAKALWQSRETLPVAVDAASVSASADALMEEACNSKIGTIPPRAYVDLSFGPFSHLEISECGLEVFFVCRSEAGEFLQVVLEPHKKYCSFRVRLESDDKHDEHLAEQIDAGVKMLLSAIVRDFWVVENRESVFRCSERRGRGHRGAPDDDGGPRVVYVPRIRYTPRTDAEKCTEDLAHTDRRSHLVRGFLRRASVPSPHQLILAQRYGIEVPKGYTFVRPHERGNSTRDIIYRSRSALQCLYVAHDIATGSTPSLWFKFECDVRKLMERLGFEVQHISLSRRGDNGIDVYATKGDDLENVNWVIQCKCWRLGRKIHPATVRELIGTLQRYPRGTRGMIVTTSSFSSGAITTAKESDIRLMDGEEFERLTRDAR